MKRRLALLLVAIFALTLVCFVADYGWLRVRAARDPGNAYDSVQVEIVYQIPQKGNKAEYVPQDTQTQGCVRSIFPHLGQQPCWYLRRHTQQQVNF